MTLPIDLEAVSAKAPAVQTGCSQQGHLKFNLFPEVVMRKFQLFFLIFALVIMVRAKGKNDIYMGGGISIPSNPKIFSDLWNASYNGGIGYGHKLFPALSVVFSLDYNNFTLDKGKDADIIGGSSSIVTISENVKFRLIPGTNTLSPYVLGGLGFFHLSQKNKTIEHSIIAPGDSESAFFVQFGAGIDIPFSENDNVFIEAKYGIGFTKADNTMYIPLRIGLRESF